MFDKSQTIGVCQIYADVADGKIRYLGFDEDQTMSLKNEKSPTVIGE